MVDLARLFPPDLSVIDGIVGGNFREWHGDSVSSGVLVAGTNLVAVDATAARLMCVDPELPRGKLPFINADNHILVASQHGLGPVESEAITVDGDQPVQLLPYSVLTSSDAESVARKEELRARHCMTAMRFFSNRERYVAEYAGETICMDDENVMLHAPMCEGFSEEAMRICEERNLGIYEVFVKRVEKKEAELIDPYRG